MSLAKRYRSLSLTRKFTVLMVATATTALIVAILLFGTMEVFAFRHQLSDRIATLAKITAVNAIDAIEAADAKAARTLVESLRTDPVIELAQIFTSGGDALASSARLNSSHGARPTIAQVRQEHRELADANSMFDARRTSATFHLSHLDVTTPILRGGEPVGFVRIVASMAALYQTLALYAWVALVIALAAVGAAYLVTLKLRSSITKPLLDLVDVMHHVSTHQNYDARVEKTTDDEVGSLMDGFNGMLAQLKEREARLAQHRLFLEQQVCERTAHLEHALGAAQQASRVKSEFLARMSHEIRTPMNGVLGMAELLQNTSLDARQRRLLGTVYGSAEALLQIINDILDFSKVEAGKLELEQQSFKLRGIVEETTELLTERAKAKRLQLACSIAPDLPAWVRGDPQRLRQVLINLIGNAIKFTEVGAVVVRARAAQGRSRIRFEVQDTGPGIPPEMQDAIFQVFTQAHTYTTRRHGGTGLGLAISQQLVRLMGGTIGVRSNSEGSLFWFEAELPAIEAPAQLDERPAKPNEQARLQAAVARALGGEATVATQPSPSEPRSLDGAAVMLVEDNEVNREVAVGMLHALGCTVEVAEHGGVAVDMYPRRRWHAILMDCQMPTMDGLAATGEIRTYEARKDLGRTPIIALTANAADTDRDKCVAIGMDDFVSKPFTMTQLRAVLEKWIGVAAIGAPGIPEAAAADAVLDQKALDAIRAIPSPDLLKRMIDLYEERTPRLILEGSAALEARDCGRIAVAVHELKSSSGNLGGQRLVRLCKECETAARGNDLAATERLWPQIATEFTAFRAALAALAPLGTAA